MSNAYGRQVVVPLTNKSGGSVAAGDVVVIDTGNNEAFTTTTTGAFTGGVGVAQETIASNATGRVLVAGYAALVNVNASVTRGQYGTTHTVVKQATGTASRGAGTFAQWLTGGTTPTARIFSPDLAAAAGNVASDAIFDGVGDIPVGTGADTAAKGRGVVLLSETVLGADAAAITFTAISGAYRDLIVTAVLRSAKVATSDDFRIRVGNGSLDTGTNYSYQFTSAANTTITTNVGTSQSTVYFGNGMASTGLANSWSHHEMIIRNYASATQFRAMSGESVQFQNSTTNALMQLGGIWRNAAAAIDQVSVFADGGNLLSGSRAAIYGRG